MFNPQQEAFLFINSHGGSMGTPVSAKRAPFKAPQLRKRGDRSADHCNIAIEVPWQSVRKFIVFIENNLDDRSLSHSERGGLQKCLADLRSK